MLAVSASHEPAPYDGLRAGHRAERLRQGERQRMVAVDQVRQLAVGQNDLVARLGVACLRALDGAVG